MKFPSFFCPYATLCGWQDIAVQARTNDLILFLCFSPASASWQYWYSVSRVTLSAVVFEAVLLQILVPRFIFCVVCCRLDSTDTMFHMSHCPLLSLKQYFCKYWCHGLSSVLSAVDLTVLILCFTHHIISCCLWSSTFFQTLMPWFIFCVVGYRLDSTDTMFHMSRSVVAFETVLFQILMPCKSFTWYIVWCRLLAVLDQISLITLL